MVKVVPTPLESKMPTYPLKAKGEELNPCIMLTKDEAKMCVEALKEFAPNVNWMVKGLQVEALREKLLSQIKDREKTNV